MAREDLRIHVVMDGEARRHLLEEGWLSGDPSRISYPTYDRAYAWMRDRMLERIRAPEKGEAWPLWGWRRRMGRSKPRAESYRLDEDHWIVSFDVPEKKVVLSDFHYWHYVLNHWYLPDLTAADGGEAEDEALWAEMTAAGVDFHDRPYPEPWDTRIRESWSKIFDVEGSRDVQATFWGVDRSMMVGETFVTARPLPAEAD